MTPLSRNKIPCVSTGMDAMPARYRAGHGRGRVRRCRQPAESSVSRRSRDDSPRTSAGRFNNSYSVTRREVTLAKYHHYFFRHGIHRQCDRNKNNYKYCCVRLGKESHAITRKAMPDAEGFGVQTSFCV